jgi:PAS domain S-box-containing protein
LASVADHIALGIERSRSTEALRTAEERMRFALEAAGIGIWDMDYRTGVLRWSEILESQYGLQPGTFPGTREAFIERIHPDDRGAVAEAVGKAIKTGADFSTQHRALQPDGTVRWLSGAGRIHFGEHGEPVRGVGISQDVTDRRHAAAALEQSVLRDVTSRDKGAAELKRHNDEIQLQRLQVFKSTMRTVQDIVNNLLNGLQLVHLESIGYVPAETLELVDRTIKEAAVKLKTLGDLETVIEKEIGFGLGIDYPGSTL